MRQDRRPPKALARAKGRSAEASADALPAEEHIFRQAIDGYKRVYSRPFPSWREVLAVLHSLGYRLVAEPVAGEALKAIADKHREQERQQRARAAEDRNAAKEASP